MKVVKSPFAKYKICVKIRMECTPTHHASGIKTVHWDDEGTNYQYNQAFRSVTGGHLVIQTHISTHLLFTERFTIQWRNK